MEKIKNKRHISWAYIWRFIFAIIILAIIKFVAANIISYFASTGEVMNVGKMLIYTANLYVLSKIIYAVIFLITIIIAWLIIHKVVSKKVCIEKQNEKYVLRMVGIITGVIMIIIAGAFFYEPIASAFGLGNSLTMSEIRNKSNNMISVSKDMQDLLRHGITTNSETLLTVVEMFDFDIEYTIQVLSRALILDWIIASIVCLAVICIIIINHKKIKRMVVDNSLDENGNIILTQDKFNNKHRKILIIVSIVLAIIVIIICTLTYRDNHQDDFLLGEKNNNQHVLIKNSDLYYEEEINTPDNYEQTQEELDEEWLEWCKLEHEDEWYLNNQISIVEAEKYQANYPDYSIDWDYANSMYDKVEQFIRELKKSLSDSNNKSLYYLEEKYDIKFSHIDTCTFAYILDNKNFLTGVGIEAIVDDYLDRNVIDIKMWDNDGILQKIKMEKEIQKLNTVNINDKLSLIYEDMTLNEVISILGNSYLFEDDVKYKEYTWYDENQNHITFMFEEDKILQVVFYKNDLDK